VIWNALITVTRQRDVVYGRKEKPPISSTTEHHKNARFGISLG
jgi:hypothetical protein